MLNLLELTATRHSTEKIKTHFSKLFAEHSVVSKKYLL